MPLNILHHKSWNVYNTENIERVRRDEENAKEEERKKKERAIQAEREFRLSLLRQKNSINNDSKSNEILLNSNLNENGHVNLFYNEEQQLNSGKNKEREEEEKREKEKFESQFIYSLTGKDKEKPWYSLEKPSIGNNYNSNKTDNNNDKLKHLKKDKKRKEIEDPLELIKKNLEKNKEIELKFKESLPYYRNSNKEENNIINYSETFTNPTELLKEFSKKRKLSNNSSSLSDSSSDSSSSSSSRKHSKHHRHNHKHKHSHKHEKSSKKHSKKKKRHKEEKHQSTKSSIEKLREERLKREQEERQRALNINGIQKPPVNLVEEDKYFYNSQFNPDSIRQLKRQ